MSRLAARRSDLLAGLVNTLTLLVWLTAGDRILSERLRIGAVRYRPPKPIKAVGAARFGVRRLDAAFGPCSFDESRAESPHSKMIYCKHET